jgi:nucleoside-diphosphate-sugar epimerase
MLKDKKVLVTGGTGQVGRPIAEFLARDNEVWCAARFTNATAREELEASGVTTRAWDLSTHDFAGIPSDFTHVVHTAITWTQDHDEAVRLNAEGTGALMWHCRDAAAFLYVSTVCVYRRRDPDRPCVESDELGGCAEMMPAYPIGKIATEGAVRALGSIFSMPTTIARLNCMYGPYGYSGMVGLFYQMVKDRQPLPIPRGFNSRLSPIHTDDIGEQASKLLNVASVPSTIVNWAGDDNISQRELFEFIAEMVGTEPLFQEADLTFDTAASDNSRRAALIGPCSVDWKRGVSQIVEALETGDFQPAPFHKL